MDMLSQRVTRRLVSQLAHLELHRSAVFSKHLPGCEEIFWELCLLGSPEEQPPPPPKESIFLSIVCSFTSLSPGFESLPLLHYRKGERNFICINHSAEKG